jgi:putative DNA primase/helicase
VSTGRPWPDGSAGAGGSVLFICAEDEAEDTLRPRLDAHGAAVQQVHVLSRVRRSGADGRPYETAFTLADVGTLEEGLRACPDCRLVVVDPIGSFLGRGTDCYRENHVRALLEPVARLAGAYGAAVLVVAHQRKAAGSRHADDLALGSRAFTGVARAVWHLTHDPQDRERRLLLPGKNNLAAQSNGLAFRIGGDPPALHWEDAAADLTADEAVAAETTASGMRTALRSQAVEWLRELLANGPVPAVDVQREAKHAGYSWRALDYAKVELGVRPTRTTNLGPWAWKLPQDPTASVESSGPVG